VNGQLWLLPETQTKPRKAMPSQVAVIAVRYENGVALHFNVPVVFAGDTLDQAGEEAMSYIRQNLLVPRDVSNRIELIAVEVIGYVSKT
jgi:hypothetical protein